MLSGSIRGGRSWKELAVSDRRVPRERGLTSSTAMSVLMLGRNSWTVGARG